MALWATYSRIILSDYTPAHLSPIWQVAVEKGVHRGSAGLPRKHQGRVLQCRKEAAGGGGCEQDGGQGGRGRAGPA